MAIRTIRRLSVRSVRRQIAKSSQRGSNQLRCTFSYVFEFSMPSLQCLADFHGFAAYSSSKVSQGVNLM